MKLKKYFRLIKHIVKISLMTAMQYKVNFLALILTTIVYSVVQLFFIKYLFAAGNISRIGGFTRTEMYLVYFLGQIVYAVFFTVIVHNLKRVYEEIHNGGLDFLLIKPINSSFAILFQSITFSSTAIYVYALGGVLYLWTDINWDIKQWLSVLLILWLSIVLLHSLFLFAIALAFYWERFYGLFRLLMGIDQFSRYPKSVYPHALQFFLSFIIPIFVVINPIYNVIDGSFDKWKLLEITSVTAVFTILAWTVWLKGLKRYASAN